MKLYTLDNKFIKETSLFPPRFTGIVNYLDGSKSWFLDGKRHRLDGPAVETESGTKYWYFNNKCHRLDGPAIEYPNGLKLWFFNDKKITELECKLLHDVMKLKGLL